MCASYGLDPRFTESELLDAADADLLDDLRTWAGANAGEDLRPTGRNLRNLNPLVIDVDGSPVPEEAWWGFLVDGAPARFPSINTRAERLRDQPRGLARRGLVPATSWFEMQKPSRVWHELSLGGPLFGMAAVVRHGVTPEGDTIDCFSLVMRPAPPALAHVHDRVPLLIPASFSRSWLTGPGTRVLIESAWEASDALLDRIEASPRSGR